MLDKDSLTRTETLLERLLDVEIPEIKASVARACSAAEDTKEELLVVKTRQESLASDIKYAQHGKRQYLTTFIAVGVTILLSVFGASWSLAGQVSSLASDLQAEKHIRAAEDEDSKERLTMVSQMLERLPKQLCKQCP